MHGDVLVGGGAHEAPLHEALEPRRPALVEAVGEPDAPEAPVQEQPVGELGHAGYLGHG